MVLTFDTETTVKNKGNCFTESNRLISYSIKCNDEKTNFHYYTDLEFGKALRTGFNEAKLLVGFNLKFDLNIVRRHLGLEPHPRVRVWDCQLAEFILRGQQGSYPSLNESLARFNLGQKDDKVAEYWALGVETYDIPIEELKVYGDLDVDLSYQLYLKQQEVMTEKQKRLLMVMGLDLLVLADMEWNGVKFDVELCKEKANETAKELETITKELLQFAPTPRINLDSGHQLSCMLYGGAFEITYAVGEEQRVYKSGKHKGESYTRQIWETTAFSCSQLFTPIKGSKTKLVSKVAGVEYPIYATGEDVLKQLKKPTKEHKRIVELLLKRAELAKLQTTYYEALPELLQEMEWGEYLHSSFNQCVTKTGRLSSTKPNGQNFPGEVDRLLITRY